MFRFLAETHKDGNGTWSYGRVWGSVLLAVVTLLLVEHAVLPVVALGTGHEEATLAFLSAWKDVLVALVSAPALGSVALYLVQQWHGSGGVSAAQLDANGDGVPDEGAQ